MTKVVLERYHSLCASLLVPKVSNGVFNECPNPDTRELYSTEWICMNEWVKYYSKDEYCLICCLPSLFKTLEDGFLNIVVYLAKENSVIYVVQVAKC